MMALALGLVGQPVQPYLTTGATDFVNSVQKGKEDAVKLKQADIVNQKSALDILSAKKKVDESSWATTNATDLKAKADKGQLDAESMARMQEANPEFAKILGTAQADAVKNFYASNLIGLNSATDQAGFLNDLVQAHDAHNAPLPESVRKDPKLAIQYYKMLLNGAKAFDDKTASMDESGNVITKDALGNTTDIKPNPNKAKAVPELDASGKEITRPTKLGNKTIYERKMSDGTWVKLAEDAPPAPKTPLNQFGPVYFDSVMGAYVQKNLSTGAIEVKDKGYEQGDAADGLNPRKQAGSQEKQRAQALLIPAGQSIKDIKNISMLSPDIKFSMAQDVVGKGGTLTNSVRNFLARSSTDVENRKYETAVKGLNNAIARLSNAGYTFTQAQANAYEEALRFTDKDTNETKIYALLTGIQHIREALKSTDLGTKEQRAKAKEYIKELDQYPEPEEFINSLHKQGATVGGLIPKTNAVQKPPQIPIKNAQGWVLHTDKNGNKAYVSPDGKQFQKVQ